MVWKGLKTRTSFNKNINFVQSFKCAIEGIQSAYRTEKNLRFHSVVFILVNGLALYWKLSASEWALVNLVCGLVIGFELLNTAIEAAVDLTIGTTYHDLAKRAKDVAAGAVLMVSFFAVIIGSIIFIPYLLNWIGRS